MGALRDRHELSAAKAPMRRSCECREKMSGTSCLVEGPLETAAASGRQDLVRAMTLWDTVMIGLAIGSTILFCFWARIRATGGDG